jgi:hypothetical protein
MYLNVGLDKLWNPGWYMFRSSRLWMKERIFIPIILKNIQDFEWTRYFSDKELFQKTKI